MVRIGNTDLEIFPLGLGGNTFGNTTDVGASQAVLDAFVAAGGNFIDTADMYAYWAPGNEGGESETILGEWMRRRGNRHDVVIGTKVGGLPRLKGLEPQTIARAAEESLQRLQTDYIDLYYAHYDQEDVPIGEVAQAFDRLVQEGKVRYVAISNMSPTRIEEWIRTAREDGFAVPVALQPEYNLVSRRNYEERYKPLAEAHELAVFPYFGLASGFLTGKYRTQADLAGRARGQAVEKYMTADGMRVLQAMDAVAAAHEAPLATVALAWLLSRPTVTAPLASATSPQQLEQLVAAPGLELAAEEISTLDEVSEAFA